MAQAEKQSPAHPNEPTLERLRQIRTELPPDEIAKHLAINSQIRRKEKVA